MAYQISSIPWLPLKMIEKVYVQNAATISWTRTLEGSALR